MYYTKLKEELPPFDEVVWLCLKSHTMILGGRKLLGEGEEDWEWCWAFGHRITLPEMIVGFFPIGNDDPVVGWLPCSISISILPPSKLLPGSKVKYIGEDVTLLSKVLLAHGALLTLEEVNPERSDGYLCGDDKGLSWWLPFDEIEVV